MKFCEVANRMAKMDLNRQVRIGTSGYSYPGPPPKGWSRVFYPENRRKRFDELEYYSSLFNTVEINTTFYRPLAPGVAEAWARRTPADFQFAIKTWQKFTHPVKLGEQTSQRGEKWDDPTQADVDLFKRSVGALVERGKLGILLFQYPASFHYTTENVERLRWTLSAFNGNPKAVELRHQSWSEENSHTKALLDSLGATWAAIDEPKFASSIRREFEPVEKIFYLRLHGRNTEKWWRHAEAWERYDYFYGPDEIRLFGDKIQRLMQASPAPKAYVFFNNHARGQAVANALMLKHELAQDSLAVVPRGLVEAYPQLSGIVQTIAKDSLF
jgi:uncharacterized protein YecE (DUF72 family)